MQSTRIDFYALARTKGGGGFLPLLPFVVLLGVSLVGCTPTNVTTFSASTAPIETSVAGNDDAQGRKIAEQFLATLKQGDYPALRQMMSPAAQAQMPPTLAEWTRRGSYGPLVGATGLQFGDSQYLSHGKKMVVRLQFKGADGAQYYTNIDFVHSNDGAWKLDSILRPAKPGTPNAGPAGAAVSAAPTH